MVFSKNEEGIIYAQCEYCGRTLKFSSTSFPRRYGKEFDQFLFPRELECFCGENYATMDNVPKLPYNADDNIEGQSVEQPWKEYFRKIQRYVPKEADVTCPVKILEVSILKDTVKDEILLRVNMVNMGDADIVAVFLSIEMEDISGNRIYDPKGREQMSYIYEDILIGRGEHFGETTAVRLPDSVRRVKVLLEKAAFLDGSLWISSPEHFVTVREQETIKLPQEFNDRFIGILKNDFTDAVQNMGQICYYYLENEDSWQCTCGKTNACEEETCTFCKLPRSYGKTVLSKGAISDRMAEYQNEAQELTVSQDKEEYELSNRRMKPSVLVKAGASIAACIIVILLVVLFLGF